MRISDGDTVEREFKQFWLAASKNRDHKQTKQRKSCQQLVLPFHSALNSENNKAMIKNSREAVVQRRSIEEVVWKI